MNIDKRALREVAEKATKGPWKVFSDIDTKTFSIHTPRDKRCENVIKWGGFDCQPNAEANAEFIAAFNPKVALAMLDELEKAQRANVAKDDHINQQQDHIEQLEKGHQEAAKQINFWRRLAKQNIAERGKDISELEAARQRIAELEARTVTLPPLAPENLASVLDGYEKWLIATTFRDTWNACLSEVVRMNAADIKVKES